MQDDTDDLKSMQRKGLSLHDNSKNETHNSIFNQSLQKTPCLDVSEKPTQTLKQLS